MTLPTLTYHPRQNTPIDTARLIAEILEPFTEFEPNPDGTDIPLPDDILEELAGFSTWYLLYYHYFIDTSLAPVRTIERYLENEDDSFNSDIPPEAGIHAAEYKWFMHIYKSPYYKNPRPLHLLSKLR